MKEINCPQGYSCRPANMDDVASAVDLFNAYSQKLLGVHEASVEQLRADWQTPHFNLEKDTRVVLDPDGQLVGYYELWDTGEPHVLYYGWGRVHPDHTGRGIGTCLLNWNETEARNRLDQAPEGTQVVLRLFCNSLATDAVQLFREQWFELIRHSLRMVINLNGAPPQAQWPDGITVRTMQPDEVRKVMHVVRDSFRDHWGYVEHPFEEEYERVSHMIQEDPLFDASLWFLALEGDEIAGVSLCRPHLTENPDMGWVGTLGVRRPWRKQGLGLALLQHSFAEFYQRGKRKVGLGVDANSLTGATRLYEKAGMASDPQRLFVTYEKVLRPGQDLSTNSLVE